MSFDTATLLLLWLVVIVLALAMAGMLSQLRQVQLTLREMSVRGPSPIEGRQVPGVTTESVILLVAPGCDSCLPIIQAFKSLRKSDDARAWRVVSERWPAETQTTLGVEVDGPLFSSVDPPWVPALVTVNSLGIIQSARPMTSEQQLQHVLAESKSSKAPTTAGGAS